MALKRAESSGFVNFEEKKRKSNLSMSFPKIVNQMGSFGEKKKTKFFFASVGRFSIFLDFALLMVHIDTGLLSVRAGSHFDISISISRHTQTQYDVYN